VTYCKLRYAIRNVGIEYQTNISVDQHLPRDHWSLPRHLLRQYTPDCEKALVTDKSADNDGTQHQGHNDRGRVPRISRAAPGETQDDQTKSKQKEDLATNIYGLDPGCVSCSSASLSGIVEFGNRLWSKEVFAQDEENDEEAHDADREVDGETPPPISTCEISYT
jgi:hypothetical protein